MNKLYSNIGTKVCRLAMFCGLLGIVGMIGSIILFAAEGAEIGIIALLSSVVCILSSWPLFAFGQMTNDVHKMAAGGVKQKNAVFSDELPEL